MDLSCPGQIAGRIAKNGLSLSVTALNVLARVDFWVGLLRKERLSWLVEMKMIVGVPQNDRCAFGTPDGTSGRK